MTSTDELADLLSVCDEWRKAMHAVPRELFVPSTALAAPEVGGLYPIDRNARPEEWWTAVNSDASIVTQRDEGKGDPIDVQSGFATSSLSAPSIAFRFLELLAPRDSDNVLEIGTGTGYTAALLSARVGEQNVTSVEVDAEVAQQAMANLEKTGLAPHVVVADGAAGFRDDAPYDRVHATVAVAEIPFAWVEQTRPGGVIVAPWQPLRGHGLMTRFTTARDVAYGRFHGPAGYMMLRSHRAELVWQARHPDDADRSGTRLDPRTVFEAGPGLQLATVDLAPGLAYWEKHFDDGAFSLLLFEVGRPKGSWAACDWEPGNRLYEVLQYGERRLWDELADAFEWWVRHDGPGVDRFGLTVTPEGDKLWLDEPTRLL